MENRKHKCWNCDKEFTLPANAPTTIIFCGKECKKTFIEKEPIRYNNFLNYIKNNLKKQFKN